MLMLMTATETKQAREAGSSAGSPTLDRGAKDANEGYGMINADAAVDAVSRPVLSDRSFAATDSFGSASSDKRCWARKVAIEQGVPVTFSLIVPAGADYDIYVYESTPDQFGNPRIKASSVQSGTGAAETISFTPAETEEVYLVVKRVSGSGAWTLNGQLPVTMSAFTLD